MSNQEEGTRRFQPPERFRPEWPVATAGLAILLALLLVGGGIAGYSFVKKNQNHYKYINKNARI